jgi:hypothetical protein
MEELSMQREQHMQSVCKEKHIKKTCVVIAERYRVSVVLDNAGKKEHEGHRASTLPISSHHMEQQDAIFLDRGTGFTKEK